MASGKARSLLRGNIGIMMLTSGIWTFGGQMTWPFWSLYVLHLGGSYFHIGLLSAVGSVVGIIPALFGGYLADTIGRKRMVYSMSFILSAATLIYLAAPSWHWLIPAVVLEFAAAGLRGPAFNALIADSTVADSRAESYALTHIVPPLFGIFSPYIIGVFMDRLGVVPAQRSAFIVLFVGSLAASLLRFRLLRETLPAEARERIKASKIFGETFSGIRETVRTMPRQLWVLTVMGVLFGFGTAVGGLFWVTYATEDVINLTNAQWGLISTSNMLVSTVVSLPFARLADRKGRLKLVLPSMLLTPIAIVAFVYSRSFLQVLAVGVSTTVLGSMSASASQALFTDHSPREHRGRINSLWSVIGTMQTFTIRGMSGSALGATGNLLGGFLYGNISKASPLLLEAGMVTSAAALGLLFLKEPEERAE